MGAGEIEIARRPVSLACGANAIGGVITDVKNQIFTSVPYSYRNLFHCSDRSLTVKLQPRLILLFPTGTGVQI